MNHTSVSNDPVEELWFSLRTSNASGSFAYLDPTLPFKRAVTDHFKMIPAHERHGVYMVRGMLAGKVLYIGRGGTITTSGRFVRQDIPHRLKAQRGRDDANTWFARLCADHGPLLVEYVFLSARPKSPALAEAELLQRHLNQFGGLPPENKSF